MKQMNSEYHFDKQLDEMPDYYFWNPKGLQTPPENMKQIDFGKEFWFELERSIAK